MSKAHGFHVMVDYTDFFPNTPELGKTMLKLMESTIDNSTAKRVHSHIEIFDGATSPPGFAAVVLLDESHLSAHCYSDKGWLAIDCFTCGGTDTETIVDEIDKLLKQLSPSIVLEQRSTAKRFLHRGE
ncbi:S-adenosylmethionine decarboxylase [Candidatus Poseidoniales archaeon]|nr:S-adenosylmethionine decarboxylase [Candidatus Poseidoniales archaeon]